MAVLTTSQIKKLEAAFFHETDLRTLSVEFREARISDAANSADPTAKQVVEGLSEQHMFFDFAEPDRWLEMVSDTWVRYRGTPIGKAMHRRYVLREPWQRTCIKCFISDPTYYAYRQEFLLTAALIASRMNLDF